MDSDVISSIDWYLQVKESGDTKTQREGARKTETMSEVSGKARMATRHHDPRLSGPQKEPTPQTP